MSGIRAFLFSYLSLFSSLTAEAVVAENRVVEDLGISEGFWRVEQGVSRTDFQPWFD
ncbi:MAG: hypothetical protein WAS24_00595 [Thermoplasmata archaeon]|jgi:hypothetical protein